MPAHPTVAQAIETPPEGAELTDNLSALFSNPQDFITWKTARDGGTVAGA